MKNAENYSSEILAILEGLTSFEIEKVLYTVKSKAEQMTYLKL